MAGPSVTKTDLVTAVSLRTGANRAESKEAVDAVFEAMASELRRGNEVSVRGFGRFRIGMLSQRTLRNPKTGEPTVAGPRRVVRFHPGSPLKSGVSQPDL